MAAAAPWPMMRTASTEHLDIRHPTPDLTVLPEGAISRTVSALEQSAEELSQGGSDIGDEIRKLQEEQRRSDSRRSSLSRQNTHNSNSNSNSISISNSVTRSRGASASSYSNSILDLNREARWGGYSPQAYIGSPAQSIHSGSWSQAVLHRSTSNAMSTSTRPEPVQEGRPLDSPLASPIASARQASHSSLSRTVSIQNSVQPSRRSSHASKRSSVGSIGSAASLKGSRRTSHEVDEADETLLPPSEEGRDETTREAADAEDMSRYAPSQHDTIPERPGSSDTYRQANILFQDFDGVHFSPTHEEFVAVDEYGNEVRRIPLDQAGRDLLQHQELLTPRAQVTFAHPPPPDHMVYYPAPVPRMLNLPKRLSAKPSPGQIAQRKSQVMMQAPKSARKSVLQIGEFGFEREQQRDLHEETEGQDTSGIARPASVRSASPDRPSSPHKPRMQTRASVATLSNMPSNLPPQLRASLFFDTPSAAQPVNIQSESAVATLDSILQASATAPVSVFTDHPFAGRVGNEVYGREKPRAKRNTIASPLISDAKNSPKAMEEKRPQPNRRRSITGLLTGNDDSPEKPKLARRTSVMSMLTDLGNPDGKKLQKRNSRMSLNSENMLALQSTSRPISPAPSVPLDQAEHEELDEERLADENEEGEGEEEEEEEEEVDDEDVGPVFAQPTTLLAELQLRKAQQKSRNRTAATAFPNGMHSTLLQLDAVAQIESQKRKHHKVALAWEDPAISAKQNEEVDEDVPLAVLYPTKNGLRHKKPGESDWDRPVGLIQKRHMEDNEPLSSRRNRILGINPKAANRLAPQGSNLSSPRNNSAPGSSRGEPSPAYAHSLTNQENRSATAQEDEDDLPLAERRRRIQQKAALDAALGDVVAKENKSTFEADVLSVLGGPVDKASPASPADPKAEPEEETLGQRRARLQREALASGAERQPLKQSMSLANLLSSVPLDASKERMERDRRNASNPAPGTLLGMNDAKTREQKEKLRLGNSRKSSYFDRGARPAVDPASTNAYPPANGYVGNAGNGMGSRRASTLLGLQTNGNGTPSANQAFGSGPSAGAAVGSGMGAVAGLGSMANPGMNLQGTYQQQMAQQHQQQLLNPLAFQSFVPSAGGGGLGMGGGMAAYDGGGMSMGMGMGMGMQTGAMAAPGYAVQNPMAMYNNNMGYGMGMGMGTGMGMGMGMGYGMGMGMGYGYGMQDLSMDPAQRDFIDQWRSSVAQ
ncbi:hypothetical protein CAC42_4632 [Sphaceloma murrayae]|uniref:Uncharacterized protein n=1 Tax=Sphaceloma murrayae TaxID=2082308 RepID=A0A2K1QNF4_9PEZI|nr:hypothetical protein CAC42_4632 [Sphaceloma murrayae]